MNLTVQADRSFKVVWYGTCTRKEALSKMTFPTKWNEMGLGNVSRLGMALNGVYVWLKWYQTCWCLMHTFKWYHHLHDYWWTFFERSEKLSFHYKRGGYLQCAFITSNSFANIVNPWHTSSYNDYWWHVELPYWFKVRFCLIFWELSAHNI